MATQTVDFSTIETVTKDGFPLSQVVLDGVTMWTSAYLGQFWTLQDESYYGEDPDQRAGDFLLTDLDATRIVSNAPNGILGVYKWGGTFWVREHAHALRPTYMNSAGDRIIGVATNTGNFMEITRTGTTWVTNVDGGVSGVIRHAFLSGDESVFMYGNSLRDWYWQLGIGGTPNFIMDDVRNAACNSNGSVVAFSEDGVTRNGHVSAGEIKVFEGAVGVVPTTQKGAFITGTQEQARLGGWNLADGSSGLAMDSSGDRIAATHYRSVNVYDWDGVSWVLTASLTNDSIFDRATSSLKMSSDGLTIIAQDTGWRVTVYEELEGVWTQVGDDLNAKFPAPPHTFALSYDKSTVLLGSQYDDTNGKDAGIFSKFKMT